MQTAVCATACFLVVRELLSMEEDRHRLEKDPTQTLQQVGGRLT